MSVAATPLDARHCLSRLVAFDTTSRRSNLECLHWIVEQTHRYHTRVRYTYSRDRSKTNALISFGPDEPGGVLLSAHTDTVPIEGQTWTVPPHELTARNGRLYGRGTSDMKGFIAACLAAMPSWHARPLVRPIHMALSYDEELGCMGVPALISDLSANVPAPAFAWVGEPTGMSIATAHKGVCVFETRFVGKSAHSSLPALGHSAVADAVRFAAFLLDLGLEAAYRVTRQAGLYPPHTTFNIGRFDGGNALNTVACECTLAWECRPIPEEDVTRLRARIRNFLAARSAGLALPRNPDSISKRAYRPGTVSHREVVFVPPLRAEGNDAARQRLRTLLGEETAESVVPFGTEAGPFQQAGLPAIVCGPGSIKQAHQPDEWIDEGQLRRCVAALQQLPMHLEAA